MQLKLNNIELKGYKSVNGSGQTLPINDDITVLIGANGVGKSNIVSFFQLLNYAMSGSLQTYIGEMALLTRFCTMVPKIQIALRPSCVFLMRRATMSMLLGWHMPQATR